MIGGRRENVIFCPYPSCLCCLLPDPVVPLLLHPNECRKFGCYILMLEGVTCLIWQCHYRGILDSRRISVEVRSLILRISIAWREFVILWINCSDFQFCGCYLTRSPQMLLSRVLTKLAGFTTQLFHPCENGVRFLPKELLSNIWRHIIISHDCWESPHLQVELWLQVAPFSPIPVCDLTLRGPDSQEASAQSPPNLEM